MSEQTAQKGLKEVLSAIQNQNLPKTGGVKFPSDYIDPELKKKPAYFLACCKAAHGNFSVMQKVRGQQSVADLFQEWRDYARGAQTVDRYKKMLRGTAKKKGNLDFSMRNLDQQPLAIAPKFMKTLMGMVLNRPSYLNIKAIDPLAQKQEREWEVKLQDEILNAKWLSNIEAITGIPFDRALEEGVQPPKDTSEIPFYKEMYYKHRAAHELTDLVELVRATNESSIMEEEIAKDLIEVGISGTRTYHDGAGFIKQRAIKYENMIHNPVAKKNFADMWIVGEYIQMSISEIREMAAGKLSEKQLAEIANKNTGGAKYSTDVESLRRHGLNEYGYPYDDVKANVLDLCWLSMDKVVHTVTKGSNNISYVERKNGHYPQSEGVSDEEFTKKSNGKKYIKRNEVQNKYQAMWIVDSEYVFAEGLASDMIRQSKSLKTTTLGYAIYTTDWDSMIRQIIPILDNIHINWMQYQHHAAKSTPSGASVEVTALQDISIGHGGERLLPRDILELAADSGLKLWKRQRHDGASNQFKPWEEFTNGMSPAAKDHWEFIMRDIDLLRHIIGINEVADASTPNPRIGKFVTETAVAATNNVATFIYRGFDYIRSKSAEEIGLLIPIIVKNYGWNYGLTEALGESTMQFFNVTKELNAHDYSIVYEVVHDNDKRNRVHEYTMMALQKQEIGEDDAILISDEPNPYKAAQMLKTFRRNRQEQMMAEHAQKQEMEMQKNQQSAQAALEAKMAEIQKSHEVKMEYMKTQEALQQARDQQRYQNEILLEMLRQNFEMGENEKQRLKDLMTERIAMDKARLPKDEEQKDGQRQQKKGQ